MMKFLVALLFLVTLQIVAGRPPVRKYYTVRRTSGTFSHVPSQRSSIFQEQQQQQQQQQVKQAYNPFANFAPIFDRSDDDNNIQFKSDPFANFDAVARGDSGGGTVGGGGASSPWPTIAPPVTPTTTLYPPVQTPPTSPPIVGGGQGPPDTSGYLPPVQYITEDQLFGGINITNLTAPYSGGEATVMSMPPVQLPDIVTSQQGPTYTFDHVYPPETINQTVVSNKTINLYTSQNQNITINNRELHRDHKILTVNTDYITNVLRYNHSALLQNVLTNVYSEHQPYLYIIMTKNDTINDNTTVVLQPIYSSQQQTVNVPPVIDTPIVEKFSYDAPTTV